VCIFSKDKPISDFLTLLALERYRKIPTQALHRVHLLHYIHTISKQAYECKGAQEAEIRGRFLKINLPELAKPGPS
jgi:hypothetical protein